MRLFPAIDLLDGACVRLYRGSYDRVTVFSREPAEVARRFVDAGARRLHVVDLDGARAGGPVSRDLVLEVARSAGVPVQVGGGIRTKEEAAGYLEEGIHRIILGTAAAESPERLAGLRRRWGADRIAAAVDVEGAEVRVRGWREAAGAAKEAVLAGLEAAGIQVVLYTDVARDGTLGSPNVEGARAVAARGFRVIVAGGVSSAAHLAALRRAGAFGAVVGRALYEGGLGLAEALAAAGDGTPVRDRGGTADAG